MSTNRNCCASCRSTVVVPALALVFLAGFAAAADKVDLPVATSGFEQWVGVVAKAMSFGGNNQASSLKALESFQAKVKANMEKTVWPAALSERIFSSALCLSRLAFPSS